MRHRANGRAILAAMVCLCVTGCFGPEHPDLSRYEYLYADGQFVPPYIGFPEGLERGSWQCFDGKTKQAFDCTFVRGGWNNYKFIFRKRK